MAFQKTILFPPAGHSGRIVTQCVRYSAAVALAVGLVLPAYATGDAEGAGNELYMLGDQICQQVVDGGADNVLGDFDYGAAAAEVDIEASAYCGCVGMAFDFYAFEQSPRVDAAEDEAARATIFAEVLTENLDTCLSPESVFYMTHLFEEGYDGDLWDECADGCQDGPIWEDEWDKLQCEYAIDGWVEPPNFDRAFVEDWIEDSGVGADSLCSCTALVMEDYAEEYEAERDNASGADPYWSYMTMAMDQCQMAMWRRPLL